MSLYNFLDESTIFMVILHVFLFYDRNNLVGSQTKNYRVKSKKSENKL